MDERAQNCRQGLYNVLHENASQRLTTIHNGSQALKTTHNCPPKNGRSFPPHKSLFVFVGWGVLAHPKPFISPINHSPLHSVPLKLGMLARKVCHEVRKTCFKPNMWNGPHKHCELVVDPNVHRDTHGDKNRAASPTSTLCHTSKFVQHK